MTDEKTNAEPSGASGGSMANSKPVAWAIMDGQEAMEFCTDLEEARCGAKYYGGCKVMPLYDHPPKSALTAAERLLLREVRDIYADEDDVKCNEIAAVIDGIIERIK